MADNTHSANKRPRAYNNRRNGSAKKARSFNAAPKNTNAEGAPVPAASSTEASIPAVEARTNTLRTNRQHEYQLFTELEGRIDPQLLSAVTKDMGFDKMTPVQGRTLATTLPPHRNDALVQAKTGTGKTLAFLLPAIQQCIDMGDSSGAVSTLVISPTRELAQQIADEAKILLKNFPKHRVEVVMGATNKTKETKRLLEKADILIATPGRLLDHMSDEATMRIFRHVDTVILDEADRLLDMGFRKPLTEIMNKIPTGKSQMQGMLFSATIPPHVEELAGLVCRRGNFEKISTIDPGEVSYHKHVQQDLIEVPDFVSIAPAVAGALKEEIARKDLGGSPKAIVFAPTAQHVDYLEGVLSRISGLPQVSSLHSRKTQSRRNKNTQEFKAANSAILVATDVIARGMDFPGVTTVVQASIPDGRESYIHRLGRTARAEADGRGIIVVAQPEKSFLTNGNMFKGIEFTPREANMELSAAVSQQYKNMSFEDMQRLYRSWVAYYLQSLKTLKWNQTQLIEYANNFAKALGAQSNPTMTAKAVKIMGIRRDTPGLTVESTKPVQSKKPQRKKPAASQQSSTGM